MSLSIGGMRPKTCAGGGTHVRGYVKELFDFHGTPNPKSKETHGKVRTLHERYDANMKGFAQRTTLWVALVGSASAFVGAPLTRPSPTLGIRGLYTQTKHQVSLG